MINRKLTLTINNNTATLNEPVTIYSYDRGIRLEITVREYKYRTGKMVEENFIQTHPGIVRSRALIKSPDGKLFKYPDVKAEVKNDTVIIVISKEWTDELSEIGRYYIQIQLYDLENSRVSLPPFFITVEKLLGSIHNEDDDINDNTAITDESPIGQGTITYDAPVKDDSNIVEGFYDRNFWSKGQIITASALNKIERRLEEIYSGDGLLKTNIEELETNATTTITAINELNALFKLLSDEIQDFIDRNSLTSINIINKGNIPRNNTLQLDIEWKKSDLDRPEVVWSSSDDSIASVDENGLVTGHVFGEVTIRCEYVENPSIFDEYTANVVDRLRFRANNEDEEGFIRINSNNDIMLTDLVFRDGIYTYEYTHELNRVQFGGYYVIDPNPENTIYGYKNYCDLTELVYIDMTNIDRVDYMFYNCNNLKEVPLLDTSNVNNMSHMLEGCTSLTEVPHFDTSNVTDMSGMLKRCSSLTEVPHFDTSNVTDMNSMFDGCSSLTEVPHFDTSNVTDMGYMLSGCENITIIPEFNTPKLSSTIAMFNKCTSLREVPLFDTSNVKESWYMFANCSSLTKVPLFIMSSNTNMDNMFGGCTSLTEVPVFDTSNVKIFTSMFKGCNSLVNIPDFDTTKATHMERMFSDCTSMTGTADPLKYWKKGNVEWHTICFTNCTNLSNFSDIPKGWGGPDQNEPSTLTITGENSVRLGSTIQLSYEYDIPDLGYLVEWSSYDPDIATVDKNGLVTGLAEGEATIECKYEYKWKVYNNDTLQYETRYHTIKDTHVINVEVPKSYIRFKANSNAGSITVNSEEINLTDIPVIDGVYTYGYQGDLTSVSFYQLYSLTEVLELDTSNVTDMHCMFYQCSILNKIPELDTSKVTNMSSMFFGCSSLTSIPQQLDTSKVTDMSGMFSGCGVLTTIPELNTSKVTDMSGMFIECDSLTTLPQQLNTSNVTNMSSMFWACSKLTNIPHLDTSKVTNMNGAFLNCSKLTSIPDLDITNVIDMGRMFEGCWGLTGIADPDKFWNNNNVNSHAECFADCTKLSNYKDIPKDWGGPTKPTTVTISGDSSVDKGQTLQLSYSINVTDYGFPVTWSSLNEDIATVDQSGLVTGLSRGTATIRCAYSDTVYSEKTITVNEIQEEIPNTIKLKSSNSNGYIYINDSSTRVDLSSMTRENGVYSYTHSSAITSVTLAYSYITELIYLDTSNITNTASMFAGCPLTAIHNLDTSKFTNMTNMFLNCISLTSIPQLDTSKVTNMANMFSGCTSMTGYADPSKYWEKGNVTYYSDCFSGCYNLDNYWDIPKDWGGASISIKGSGSLLIGEEKQLSCVITDYEYEPPVTWSSLNEDIATVDQTGLVRGISEGTATIRASHSDTIYTEINIKVVTTIDESKIIKFKANRNSGYLKFTDNITGGSIELYLSDMDYDETTEVYSADMSPYDISNVYGMFCYSNVTSIIHFDNSILNTSTYDRMFFNCRYLRNINFTNDWNMENVHSVSNMFAGCSSMTGTANPDLFWNCSSIKSYSRCFYNCTKLSNYSSIPSTWK